MVSTVTPFEDMVPSPRVTVDIDAADLHVDAVKITVWQQSKAGQYRVRNMVNRSSVGGFFETDYEVPLGIPVTYRVEQFNASGTSLGFALTLETQVDIADSYAVLQDPLAPGNAVLVEAHTDFGGVLQRSRPTRTYRVGDSTVAQMGLRGLLQDVPLHCQTRSLEDADMLDLILAETQVLVRLMPSGGRLPSILNVVIPDPVEVPVDVQYGGEWVKWDLSGVEVSRTEIDIIVPTYTWQTLIDYHASLVPPGDWADVIAARSSWLEVRRDPFPEP